MGWKGHRNQEGWSNHCNSYQIQWRRRNLHNAASGTTDVPERRQDTDDHLRWHRETDNGARACQGERYDAGFLLHDGFSLLPPHQRGIVSENWLRRDAKKRSLIIIECPQAYGTSVPCRKMKMCWNHTLEEWITNTFFKSHSITKGKKPTHGRPCMPSSKGQRTYGAHAEGAWNVAYLCWTMKMIWNFTKTGQLYWLQRGSSISTRRSQ